MFIVPNPAHTAGTRRAKEEMTELARINGVPFDAELDDCVEVWMHNDKDLDSDNLGAHGFHVKHADGTYECAFGVVLGRFIPASILKGKKEGDIIRLTIPGGCQLPKKLETWSPETFTCNIALQQIGYHYEEFGNFEDAFGYVTK